MEGTASICSLISLGRAALVYFEGVASEPRTELASPLSLPANSTCSISVAVAILTIVKSKNIIYFNIIS
jgi:hypothetical protein